MNWIGLTGGLATGKSTLSQRLLLEGFPVIDADHLAKQALHQTAEPYQLVVSYFGTQILGDDGHIDRNALAKIIFNDEKARQWLESVTHPWIQNQVKVLKNQYQEAGQPIVFYDVPLLFEKGLVKQFDYVVTVFCSQAQQIKRALKRNPSWGLDQVQARLSSQMDIEEKVKQSDFVFDNSLAESASDKEWEKEWHRIFNWIKSLPRK